MSDQDYHPPRFRTLLLAGIVFAILLVLFLLLSDTVKFIGAPFLYLPDRLGILRQVQRAEIITIDLASAPATIDIAQPGRYLVFTGDFELLQQNVLSDESEKPWLLMRALGTNEPVTLTPIARGLRPYDTPLTAGRPIFSLEIATPGAYGFSYPVRSANIALLPDYMTGNEITIAFVYTIQLATIVFLFGAVYYYRRRGFRAWKQRLDKQQAQRRTHGEAFWQSEIQRVDEEQKRER
jgi:hypothetical protein